MKFSEPRILEGNIFTDDRGVLSFNNDFSFLNIKRFYTIHNHDQNFIRAWHAHQYEEKYFLCTEGSFMVCGVKIDNFKSPSKTEVVKKFYLSNNGCLLYIPKGYANGFINLTKENKLIVFSNKTLKESLNDDFRFDYDYWNVWIKNYR
jgi:dTDP-4-dehydrorhamnose 3,5-epimerase-like enzyme